MLTRPGVETEAVEGGDDSRESLALPLAFGLSIAAAAIYAVLWLLLKSTSGCGPPGHSTSGRVFSAAPFVLPFLAALALVTVGARRKWGRRPTGLAGVITV